MSIELVEASDGSLLPLGSLAHAYYDEPGGDYSTDTVVHAGVTYVQTTTYDGDDTTVSRWIPQP